MITAQVRFTVPGVPVQKGSMKAFARLVSGKPVATVTADNRPQLKSWQHAVAYEATRAGATVLEDAVAITVIFRFVRPASVPAKSRPRHIVKPDLDKLVRAVLDGLTGIAFRDDAQVTHVNAYKQYGESAGADIAVMATDY